MKNKLHVTTFKSSEYYKLPYDILTQDMVQWQAVVNTGMNLQVP